MYYEMYGDRLLCINLLSLFYRTQLKQKQLKLKKNSELNDNSNTRNVTNATDNEATEEADDNTNDISRGKINALSVIDIFEHANNELLKINVNQLRINKKQRLQRSDDFYRDIYHTILNDDD